MASKAETLEALRAAVRKWQDICDGKIEDLGPQNCPLCERFFFNRRCSGCPVAKDIGQPQCDGTPYVAWSDYHDAHEHEEWRVDSEETQEMAVAELDYLKSLLAKWETA